jgi:hypothetical protein
MSKHKPMTGAEYKKAIAQLGLSQQRAGLWLGLSPRTGQTYASEGAPKQTAMLLRLMLKYGERPEEDA